jgi:hypothetical protein
MPADKRAAAKTLIRFFLFSIASASFIAGCSMGPQTVQGNRLDYNVTLQRRGHLEFTGISKGEPGKGNAHDAGALP